MFTRTVSRKTILISLAIATAIALSLVLAASSANRAQAYPAGWTVQSKFGPEGGAISSVSVEAWANYVWVAWRGGPSQHAIGVQRSSDKGATWSAPFYLEDGTYSTDEPLVIMGTNRGDGTPRVFVIYGSKRDNLETYLGRYQTWIARSDDYGATWDPQATRWHTTTNADRLNHRADRFPGSNVIGWVHEKPIGAGYITEAFYGGRINTGGTVVFSDKRVSPNDDLRSYEPDIACFGVNQAFVVWTNEAGGGYAKANIRYQYTADYGQNFGLYGSGTSSVVGHDDGYRHSNPSIEWVTNNPVVVCSLERPSPQNWWVNRYYFVFGADEWGPTTVELAKLFSTTVTRPYPHVYGPMNYDYTFYRYDSECLALGKGDGFEINTAFLGTKKIAGSVNAISCPGQHADRCVAALTQDGEGYFRRRDSVPPPTAVITKPDPGEGTLYYNRDFEVNATAIDDFVATTQELADGKNIHSGIASVGYRYSEDGSTWTDLPTTEGGSAAGAPPYKRTAKAADLEGKRFKLKMIATDSAGNTKEAESNGWIVVDSKKPETSIAVKGTAGDNGWYTSDISCSLSSPDPNLAKTEYRVLDLSGSSGGANWTTYKAPFTVGEGKWKVYYRSSDKAGNVEAEKSRGLKSDQTPPVAAIMRPSKDHIMTDWKTEESFQLSGTATDENGLVWSAFVIDGSVVYQTDELFNMGFMWKITDDVKEKTHEIRVAARDRAGNAGSTAKNVWVGNCAHDFYFAEGNTLPEFDQWILMVNPGDQAAQVQVNFMLEDGGVIASERNLAPKQRDTLRVKDVVPVDRHVATHVHSDTQAIIAECAMYFRYKHDDPPGNGVPSYNWKGGHNVMGMNVLQNTFYFAEGTTRKNPDDGYFEEWICLQNPSPDTAANVVITYMLGTGQTIEKGYQVGPHSRYTVEVENDVGVNQDVSAKVESDVPIAAVRPQYFNYRNYALDGSAVVGASSPATEWSFAEGATHAGFQPWLTIQNPNNVPAEVEIIYYTGEGQEVKAKETVGPTTRKTVDVLMQVGQNQDVSSKVISDVPVICERPQYFVYGLAQGKGWNGGEAAMGNPGPSTKYYVAEGCTLQDPTCSFDTYYTILNGNDKGTTVRVDYMFPDGALQRQETWVYPHSRQTIFVNDVVGEGVNVSAEITSGLTVSIERPMYFNYHGITGGHNVVGFGVD